ncbi:UDP-N-acetylmuramoyl-L-alanyl-D-glutamate--2,6-diaminopimelate ligase, partial [Candidatus Parcubacteria bacterium]
MPSLKRSLSALVRHLPAAVLVGDGDPLITGVTHDSRQVQPGALFVAVPGLNVDGHRFVPDAIERGAAAVVGTQPLDGLPVPYVRVEDARGALAVLSAAFHGFPARKLTVIGVTGTDGKTTTANLIFSILKAAGIPAGLITTV